MTALVHHTSCGPLGRSIYSVDVATPEELVRVVPPSELAGQHFVLFLAWNARATPDETVLACARELVRSGLSYIVAWGQECERVHDIFDDADILENPDSNQEDTQAVVMSTWHTDERLEDALWFAVNSAYPAEAYEATTVSTIAAVVGSVHWAKAVKHYLADLSRLDAAVGV